MPPKYQLKVRFTDCVLEDDMEGQLPTARIGCFVQYGGQFLDVLMIQEGAHTIKPDNMTLDLNDLPGSPDPKVVFIIKDIQDDEPYVGSVSIARSILLEGVPGTKHVMWVTLFDDQGDDEYDGALGLNDDEDPRVQFEFTVIEVPEPKPEPKEQVPKKSIPEQKPQASTKAPANYLNPIGNARKRDSMGTTGPTTPGRTAVTAPAKPVTKPTSASRASKITKPAPRNPIDVSRDPISTSLGRLAPVHDISNLLNQNNDKR